MHPVFIYFREAPFNDNNKFALDFQMNNLYKKFILVKKTDYYIASLDCNLILKEDIKKDKKKLIEELSNRSRLLLEIGADYQNDIGWLTSYLPYYYNFPEFGVTYNFIIYPKILDEHSCKYKFYDTVDKRIKDCKIYLPFSHFKGNGFEFQRIGPKKNDTVSVSLFDDNKKIKTTFIHNSKEINYYTNIIYRDMNSLCVKDALTGKWYSTSENLYHGAIYYATKMKMPFNISKFWGDFYEVQKKGAGYVKGTLRDWQKLVPKGLDHLMPFIVHRTSSGCIDVSITKNKKFFTPIKSIRLPVCGGLLKN